MNTEVLIIVHNLQECCDKLFDGLAGVCASVIFASMVVGCALIAHKFMKGDK